MGEGSGLSLPPLIETERRVLGLLVEGADGRTIASELRISKNEVRTHEQSLLNKLNVHSRLEDATYAVTHGIPVEEARRRLGKEPTTGGEHPHLSPMDDAQLLTHVRRMHARGIPQFRSVTAEELRRQHYRMHGRTPPK